MSVDSTALERSALERKDRDELMTIAQALGGKPGSRAKKADIVDLILELTGVSSGSTEAEEAPADALSGRGRAGGRARKPTAEADEAPGEPAEGAEPESPTDATDADKVDAGSPGEEPPAEWELEADTGDESPEAGRPGDRAEGNGGNRGGERRPRGDQSQSDHRGPGNQSQGAQASQPQSHGNQAQAGGGQADQGDEDGEGANRRRRRRGRNRDRGNEPVQNPDEFTGEPIDVEGYLDLRDEGYGFLRVSGFLPSRDDVYISVKQARQFGLRKGDHLQGASRPALRNEKNPALLRIDSVNGADPEKARDRRHFEDLTPLFPDEKLVLEQERDPANVTARIIDLIAPIGKGQRGMIVSPPKAGKTTIMKQIVRSIETNNPEVHLFVLLVDERPEEVTDMRRWLKNERSTVVASTFDRPTEEHTQVAELTIERAKRLVEDGQDVVIILDGITRLARAYNLAAPTTGRVMSGGIDTGALYPPKKFFGAARNVEEGGSLTILATALVETGSRMDEVIFEEFKGTGNMELRLDRRLAERRVYPAIDIDASSTRHEELLFQGVQLQNVWKLRRVLSAMASEGSGATGLEMLIDRMKAFKSNKEFLAEIGKAPGG
ncbi:MAG TPA: transcription termination factor Rho [Acidimicrobiales bacterium]|nr:transcription termination factor Rho [Acidimicrobiales bacterium]